MSRMYTAMCSLQHDLSNQQFPLYNTWSNRLFSIGDEQPCYQHEAISPTSRHEDFEYVTFPYYHGLDPLANGTESLQDADPHYEIEKTAFSEEWQSMGDDTMVKLRPSAYVDYFSHDWREEDLETSWKCLVAQRHELQNRSRLENALWRTWAQVKNDLDTLPPSKLCWMKDHDITWLYGPFHANPQRSRKSDWETVNTRYAHQKMRAPQKSLLKQKSQSVVMLRRSLLSTAIRKENSGSFSLRRESMGRQHPGLDVLSLLDNTHQSSLPLYTDQLSAETSPSATEPGLRSPEPLGESPSGETERHVSFNEEVEQCIALDKGRTKLAYSSTSPNADTASPRNEVLETKEVRSESQVYNGICTIDKLPPTSLKHNGYGFESIDDHSTYQASERRFPILSPKEFLNAISGKASAALDLDDGDADLDWQAPLPSGTTRNAPSGIMLREGGIGSCLGEDKYDGVIPMKKSSLGAEESGAFMPCTKVDAEKGPESLFSRFVRKINTARDIAYVVWTCGRQ